MAIQQLTSASMPAIFSRIVLILGASLGGKCVECEPNPVSAG